MRIVTDTNVLISSLGWRGPEHRLLEMVFDGRIELCLSPEILEEFALVCRRDKLGFDEEDIDEFLTALIDISEIVMPEISIQAVMNDPKDNMVLECALRSGADAIVSGDRHLLDINTFENIRILNASALLSDLE